MDIGAGVGTESIIFSKDVGESGRVFAVEAHPGTFKALSLLKSLNDLRNVENFNLAITDINGKVNIDDNVHHVANSIVPTGGYPVAAMTLDKFIATFKISKIDFLKVNIEGAEEEMILGIQNTINIVDNIAVSCHDFLQDIHGNRIKNSIVDFLSTNGFEMTEKKLDTLWEIVGFMLKEKWADYRLRSCF